jgi:hypothetical protein
MCRLRGCHKCLEKGARLRCQNLVSKVVADGVFHKGHLFHFFSGDGVNDCIGLVLLGSMVISQGDGHVGSVHAVKVVLGQVVGSKILLAPWQPRR